MPWTKAAVRKAVEDLEEIYGREDYAPRYEPLDELISCILTQHTTDATAFPTFDALREKYSEWRSIAALRPETLADEIRKVGLANQKARSISGVLAEVHRRNGAYTLEPLRGMPMEEARQWLRSLPGVGPKTAAIVLAFAFGLPAIPVDTHVFRVSWRLGLIDKSIGEAKAHDVLARMVPADLAFRFHVAFIRHGRQTCKAPRPLCPKCPLRRRCRFYKEQVSG